jgi:hypothetical protein
MIKLKSLIRESVQLPDSSLAQYLLSNKVHTFENWLYHGTPLDGLKLMLVHGISGTQHGEIADYETFSTSVNSQVLELFSESNGETGLQFYVKDVSVLVLDDIVHYLSIEESGSGMEVEVDEELLENFCQKFNIRPNRWGKYSLPYGYLSSLGVDAVCYDYVWKNIDRQRYNPRNEENEVCFLKKGIEKLNSCIAEIWVDGNTYKPEQKQEAIQDIDSRI